MIRKRKRHQPRLVNSSIKLVLSGFFAILALFLIAEYQAYLAGILLLSLSLILAFIPFRTKRKPKVLYLPEATNPPLKLLPANGELNR
ncbi:MAG TPA: hypothetical protein DCY88_30990 [Cyanobacteria bacterium UBA11372]|nr:hypothetical protein [Cyanobacteria bacterium UBA11372]